MPPRSTGVSLALVASDLAFWSDASDVGWGAHLVEEVALGLWSPEEVDLSINARELLAVERGILSFQALLVNSTVSIFVDNATAVAYLSKQGGTRSSTLNAIAQCILRWAEPLHIVLAPQFIMGRHNVLADSVGPQSNHGLRMDAQDGRLSGSAATMAGDGGPVCHLVQSPLFTLFHSLPRSGCTGDGRAHPELGRASDLRLPSLGDDPSSSQEATCLLGSSHDAGASILASTAMVPGSSGAVSGRPVSLPLCHDLLRQPHFHWYHLGICRLSLHAWRLSSDSPGLRASPLV